MNSAICWDSALAGIQLDAIRIRVDNFVCKVFQMGFLSMQYMLRLYKEFHNMA